MTEQAAHWSRAAINYEKEFIDPYHRHARNPLLRVLRRIPDAKSKIVADLGCGIGPLLPFLSDRFQRVVAIDFAQGMLDRARQRAADLCNVEFHQRSMTDLAGFAGIFDVVVAVNSLVLPNVREMDEALRQIRASMKPGGRFIGIVPAMDGLHYYNMLLLDRALQTGMPLAAARKNAAHWAEHETFDFTWNGFNYQGLEQHFWHPFEIRYRLARAGFSACRLRKVHLAWEHFAQHKELQDQPPPWDWFFVAK